MSGKIIITANGGTGKTDHIYNLCYNGEVVDTYTLKSDKDVATWEVDDYKKGKTQYVARKSDTGNITVNTIEITTEKGYDLQVKYVKCWWAEVQIANSASTDIYYNDVDKTSVDQDAVNSLLDGADIADAAEKILESVAEKSKTGTKSASYTKEKNPNIFVLKEYSQYSDSNSGQEGFLNGIYNKICNDTSKTITYAEEKNEANLIDDMDKVFVRKYKNKITEGYFFSVITKETLINNGIISESESDYEYDAMNTVCSDIKTKDCSIVQTKSLTYGVPSGSYNMDGVLALLKDSSTGKPKEYKDIYDRNNSDNSKIAPGEMLVNGAEMIFNLLDASENTEGLSDVMRYLLYLYSGNDYGVTEAGFGMFSDLGFAGMSSSVVGNTIQDKVWYGLKSMGFSDIAIAAAMGNIHYESNTFNPEKIEDGYNENNGGIGICQWTNSPNRDSGKGRNTQLKKYAEKKGTTWKDMTTQVEFLMAELNPSGGALGCATYQLMDSTYTGKEYKCNDWKNAVDSEELDETKLKYLTEVFMFTFERPKVSDGQASLDKRYKHALYYYNYYHGKSLAGGTIESGNSSQGITTRFTSNITGKTFTVFLQGHKNIDLGGLCNKAAAASIASGYRKSGESEMSVINKVKNAHAFVLSNVTGTDNFFKQYGLKANIMGKAYNRNNIKNALLQGKYVCLWIEMSGTGKAGYGKSGTKYCNENRYSLDCYNRL